LRKPLCAQLPGSERISVFAFRLRALRIFTVLAQIRSPAGERPNLLLAATPHSQNAETLEAQSRSPGVEACITNEQPGTC